MSDTDITPGAVEALTDRLVENYREPVPELRENDERKAASVILAQAERISRLETALNSPSRHAYKVGIAAGRASALREVLAHKWVCSHNCDEEIEVVNADDISALIEGSDNDA